MSCLVTVSLSFTVTFHLPPLCAAVSASVNSISPQYAVLYWHESKARVHQSIKIKDKRILLYYNM